MTNSSWETNLGIMQINPKYTNEGKREVLTEFFGDKKLKDANKPVAVTSYDIEKRLPVLLTSYGDQEISAVDSGDATSAAPVYYPTAQVGDRFNRWRYCCKSSSSSWICRGQKVIPRQ